MNEVIVRPSWHGQRYCGTCQNENIIVSSSLFQVVQCPLMDTKQKVYHAQVMFWGACVMWKQRYENHCWNCGSHISSQYCRRSPNYQMGYVCSKCGKDLSEWKGRRVNTYI